METTEELEQFLTAATEDGLLGRLLYRGAAWSLMRVEGVLPEDVQPLGKTIEVDLAEHGFALLRAAMSLRSKAGSSPLTSKAFERAGNAFEAIVRNGDPKAGDRGFKRTLAATAYHLAGYSAVAYSLFNEVSADLNSAPAEVGLMRLLLRDLDGLRSLVREWLASPENSDEALYKALQGEESVEAALATVLNTGLLRALAYFDFALETGSEEAHASAIELLSLTTRLANNAANVPLWWISSLCRHLVDDLWGHSLHQVLPTQGPGGSEETYKDLRALFIGVLFSRKVSEVELWPSQREAAARSIDLADDLVVSLPTSAGKTRVAEIASLMTLSTGRRVLIVTPLRALSAQTERSFRKTFEPLGFSVSSLYGASGVSSSDEDALGSCSIVISTPEKIDFALRNDPELLNDVGLIVLDEGHMIGPSEREIRYETLVQRLLRRSDADTRRIVCLSAILPSGEELDDLTMWIRADEPGETVRCDWRPTRQRYGRLTWQGSDALLSLDLENDGPRISKFVEQVAARGKEKNPYPRLNAQLTLFAAWEFARKGKRTLIFSTQANWVEGYGKKVVDLTRRGYLDSLLDDQASIARAVEIGNEWLGEKHPAVVSLKSGVAIHHGRLPSPFLRELELLISDGTLKVIVASPTLSQGLNLNAAVLLVPALYRAGKIIEGEEFANVAGRAGRAFVDVEGLIVHTIFDKIDWRTKEWKELVASTKARTLKSGLIQIVAEILVRLSREGVLERDDAWEYLSNSREAWRSATEEAELTARLAAPEDATQAGESEDDDSDGDDETERSVDEEPLAALVERLDTTVFGLIEALDSEAADLPSLLDAALTGSLWARQVLREPEGTRELQRQIFDARANLIWSNTSASARRGHFAMGVGLDAGLTLDAMADELESLLDEADLATISGDSDTLATSLAQLAKQLLVVRPFIPDKKNALLDGWQETLSRWVTGTEVATIGPENMKMVEEAFTYRLVWALEALRTRRSSLGRESDLIAGGAAAVLETGVPTLQMAMLIRAGLPSRRAAMAAVAYAQPDFFTPADMRAWLQSNEVEELTDTGLWPTPETSELWRRFLKQMLSESVSKWTVSRSARALDISADDAPPAGLYRIDPSDDDGRARLLTPDYSFVASFKKAPRDQAPCLLSAVAVGGKTVATVIRIGRGEMRWPLANT